MKLYIPQLKDTIRLTSDLRVRIHRTNHPWRYGVQGAAWRVLHGDRPYEYHEAEKIQFFDLEVGTVLEFRRYHVSLAAKTNDIEVAIFAHPRRDLTPKKNGGTGRLVKFTLPTGVLNDIEYEKLEL